jgi:hypothetical protein
VTRWTDFLGAVVGPSCIHVSQLQWSVDVLWVCCRCSQM